MYRQVTDVHSRIPSKYRLPKWLQLSYRSYGIIRRLIERYDCGRGLNTRVLRVYSRDGSAT